MSLDLVKKNVNKCYLILVPIYNEYNIVTNNIYVYRSIQFCMLLFLVTVSYKILVLNTNIDFKLTSIMHFVVIKTKNFWSGAIITVFLFQEKKKGILIKIYFSSFYMFVITVLLFSFFFQCNITWNT